MTAIRHDRVLALLSQAHIGRHEKFSASSRLRDLNRSATNIPSACRIANIAINDAMILPYGANWAGWNFRK